MAPAKRQLATAGVPFLADGEFQLAIRKHKTLPSDCFAAGRRAEP
jgi:hypothetical protein